MKELALVRIDDRLIHGQVVTAWVKQYKITNILIVDDQLVKDVFMQKVLTMAAPPGIDVSVKSESDAIALLNSEAVAGENILLLVKVPIVLERLKEQGVPMNKIILGGMGAKAGRKKFTKNVSANEDEVACLRRLLEGGAEIVYQLVPDEKPTSLDKLMT